METSEYEVFYVGIYLENLIKLIKADMFGLSNIVGDHINKFSIFL